MATELIMRVSNLCYCYGDVEVWSELSFDIVQGELVYLVGENGSGKSTLLRCLAGQSAAKDGSIEFLQETFPATRSLLSQLHLVSDVPSFYDDLTAEEHIDFIFKANQRVDMRDHAFELLEVFGLSHSKKRFPSSFSRGMREKLALTIAFALQPRLLLMDEPFGPLDAASCRLLTALISEQLTSGTSIILSCHQIIPGLRPDRIFHIAEGTLREISMEELELLWLQSPSQTAEVQ